MTNGRRKDPSTCFHHAAAALALWEGVAGFASAARALLANRTTARANTANTVKGRPIGRLLDAQSKIQPSRRAFGRAERNCASRSPVASKPESKQFGTFGQYV
jgi:hypothetical protein